VNIEQGAGILIENKKNSKIWRKNWMNVDEKLGECR